jgi:hypothetical protein
MAQADGIRLFHASEPWIPLHSSDYPAFLGAFSSFLTCAPNRAAIRLQQTTPGHTRLHQTATLLTGLGPAPSPSFPCCFSALPAFPPRRSYFVLLFLSLIGFGRCLGLSSTDKLVSPSRFGFGSGWPAHLPRSMVRATARCVWWLPACLHPIAVLDSTVVSALRSAF